MIEEYKFVVDNSNYVSINDDNINEFTSLIDNHKYVHWINDINLNLEENKLILLAFIIESMNFCFWIKPKWKIEYNGDIVSGSNALFYSIIKEVCRNENFLNMEYLINLSKENFYKIFASKEGDIPLKEERYNNFKEVINVIYNNKDFYNEIYSIKSDTLLLKYIIDNFSSFDDKSIYKGRTIHFNKRAILLVNDLFYISKTINSNLVNVNNLTGCADYGIPRTFRDYQILEYSSNLKISVDNEKEIIHGSEMEVEIRASMLYVIELIKQKLKDKGVLINSIELDNIIWWMGKKNKNKKSIVHHTVTTYY